MRRGGDTLYVMMLRGFVSVRRRRLAEVALAAGLGAVLAFGGCSKNTSDKDLEIVTAGDLLRELTLGKNPRIALVDPRPPAEFKAAHIPGARNINLPAIPVGFVEPSLEGFDKIVVYGNDPSSPSAKAMSKRLISNGHSDVKWLAGGLEEWLARGGRVEGDGTAPAVPQTPPRQPGAQ